MNTTSFNNNSTWSLEEYFYIPFHLFPFLKVFCIICYSITCIAGLIGNGLVIWIAGFKMKTIMAVWFLNLAIADFMCCAFLPVRIAEWALFDDNNYPVMLCLFSSCILILSMCSSVYFLTIISIDRCLSIVWPIRTRLYRTLKIARIISGTTWAVSIILSTPFVILNLLLDFSDCAPKVHQLGMSQMFLFVKILRNIRLAFMFVIPLTIIFVSYALIFFKLKKLMKRQRSHQCYRTVISVVVCFFVCWFPYYTWPFIPIGDTKLQMDNFINEIFITLAYFNSCINPILYVFFCRDFKDNFIRSIPARLERAFTEKYDLQCNIENALSSDGRTEVQEITTLQHNILIREL